MSGWQKSALMPAFAPWKEIKRRDQTVVADAKFKTDMTNIFIQLEPGAAPQMQIQNLITGDLVVLDLSSRKSIPVDRLQQRFYLQFWQNCNPRVYQQRTP